MTSLLIPPDDTRRTLSEVIESLGHGEDPKLTLAEVVDSFGERAFGALILILALMALFPWPPGGKAIFSVPIMLLSVELAIQRQTVWLPRWLLKFSVNRAAYREASSGRVLRSIRAIEALTRPRLPALTGERADMVTGIVCFVLAIMLALPVPLGDMLPALTIAVFGLGITQRDGLAILIGAVGTVICGVYLVLVWATVMAIATGILNWFNGLVWT